jgi:large conductance mechanosensitive channel
VAFIEDFKKFAFKGNVVDLAVGIVVGGAFGKIVSALVADIFMPLVALVLPSGDWRANGLVLRGASDPKDNVIVKYGDFVGALLDFFVISLVLFIVVSRVLKAAEGRLAKPEAAQEVTTKECPFCCETVPLKATRCKFCTSQFA